MEDSSSAAVPVVAPAAACVAAVPLPGRSTPEELCQAVERWLRSPAAASQRKADGSVPAASVVCASEDVMRLSGGDPLAVVGAVLSCPGGPVTCDRQGSAVRLRGLLERVRSLAEVCVMQSRSGSVGLMELVQQPSLQNLLTVVSDTAAKLQTLRDALSYSEVLIEEGACVVLRPELLQPNSPPMCLSPEDVLLLPAFEAHWPDEYSENPIASNLSTQHPQHEERPMNQKARLCADIASLLNRCPACLARNMEADGFVSVRSLLDASKIISHRCYETPKLLLRAIATTKQFEMIVDEKREAVRLMNFEEKLCAAAEWCLRKDGASEVLLRELAARPEMMDILMPDAHRQKWSWDVDWIGEQLGRGLPTVPDSDALAQLGKALETSDKLRMLCDAGECWVARRPFEAAVCAVVEDVLEHNAKALAIQAREGEVPVAWIAELPQVRNALQREGIDIDASGESAHEAICRSIRAVSQRYELTGCRAHPSIQPSAPHGGTGEPPLLLPDVIPSVPKRLQAPQTVMPQVKKTYQPGTSESQEHVTEVLKLDRPLPAGQLDRGPAAQLARSIAMDPFEQDLSSAASWAASQLSRKPSMPTRWARQKLERDAKSLRNLLNHYFEPFNLQHNRLLMSLVEEQCDPTVWLTCKLPPPCWCPRFRVNDLLALPRLQKIFVGYSSAHRRMQLLQHALPEVNDADSFDPGSEAICPWVRLCGSQSGELYLELLFPPQLRLIVEPIKVPHAVPKSSTASAKQPTAARLQLRPELRALLDFEVGPHASVQRPPANVLLVVSYSISSDLSHSQSPKGEKTRRAVYAGLLDPALLIWENRLQRLKRQLLYYGADVVCLQAVQSIGFDQRCSEDDNGWFKCADEPQANHLVYLYRALMKENYDVVYAPTLMLPGSKAICLGNAIFWKRSRWRLDGHYQISKGAVCAELSSRVGGPRILACSAKMAASYSMEWGEPISQEVMLGPLSRIAEALLEKASATGAQPIWCGDFGCEPKMLRPFILGAASQPENLSQNELVPLADPNTHIWHSSYAAASEAETWTSASENLAGKAVDYVLYTKLELLAVLSGRPGDADVTELLNSGYPSDHLLLMVAFKAPCCSDELDVPDMSSGTADAELHQRGAGGAFGSDGASDLVVGNPEQEATCSRGHNKKRSQRGKPNASISSGVCRPADSKAATAQNMRKTRQNSGRCSAVGAGPQKMRVGGGIADGSWSEGSGADHLEDEIAETVSSPSSCTQPPGCTSLSEVTRPPLRQGKGRSRGRRHSFRR